MSNPSDDRTEQTGNGEIAVPREARQPVPTPEAPATPNAPLEDNRSTLGGDAEQPVVEDFNDQISNCDEDFEAIEQQIGGLIRQREQIIRERDQLIVERDRFFPRPNAAEALRAHLDQQQRNREARAGKLAQLAELGLASSKAPIDAVRSRPLGYGRRPIQYPLICQKPQ